MIVRRIVLELNSIFARLVMTLHGAQRQLVHLFAKFLELIDAANVERNLEKASNKFVLMLHQGVSVARLIIEALAHIAQHALKKLLGSQLKPRNRVLVNFLGHPEASLVRRQATVLDKSRRRRVDLALGATIVNEDRKALGMAEVAAAQMLQVDLRIISVSIHSVGAHNAGVRGFEGLPTVALLRRHASHVLTHRLVSLFPVCALALLRAVARDPASAASAQALAIRRLPGAVGANVVSGSLNLFQLIKNTLHSRLWARRSIPRRAHAAFSTFSPSQSVRKNETGRGCGP